MISFQVFFYENYFKLQKHINVEHKTPYYKVTIIG